MPTSDLEAVGVEENAPMPIVPLPGLHMNPEPGEDPYVQSPSAYESGENYRRMSVPSSSRQGSYSYQGNGSRANTQTCDDRVIDPQSADGASYFNRASHPIFVHGQSNPSQSNFTQNERRGSQPESFRQNNPRAGRRSSRRESIPEESQRRDSNTQTWQDSTRTGSNDVAPAELAVANSTTSSVSLKWWRRRPSFTQTGGKPGRWRYLIFPLTISLSVGLIVALVFDFKLKEDSGKTESLIPLSEILPQSSILPIIDSRIGVGNAVIGTYFSTAASGVLQTKLAYNAGGKICIRTKSGTDWLNVQCLEGANPRENTPIAFLDWIGGPSLYFITADNFLSGFDHIPMNDTWKFSTLRDQKRPTHPQSQLAAVTWLNGTSTWIYYQDINSQIREFGLDDYRNYNGWRDGSNGELAPALTGTGIGTARWLLGSDGSEVLEIYFQVSGGTLHGKLYLENTWASGTYAVEGTPNSVAEGAALTSTVIHQTNATMVLLAYVSSDGFLTVQSRGTANQTSTAYSAFSTPVQIFLGDGGQSTGIAAFDSEGHPMIYIVKGNHVFEISASDVAAQTWNSFDVTAVS